MASATLEAACEAPPSAEVRQDWYDACEAYCATAFGDCLPAGYVGQAPDPAAAKRCHDFCDDYSTVGEYEREHGYDDCLGLKAEYHLCVADAGVECVPEPGLDLDEDGEDDRFWSETPECREKRAAAEHCMNCVDGCKSDGCQPGCRDECEATIEILSQCSGIEDDLYPTELACREKGCAPSIAGDEPCDTTAGTLLSLGACYGASQGVCEGRCFVATEAGCGEGCLEDCSAKMADATCGAEFLDLINCETGAFTVECENGALALLTNACGDQSAAYEACLAQ